nr:toprim domain-containing protein [Rhodomicrobium vannielii]
MAVHTTFLAPDGSGKAPIDPKRKIWPLFAGSAIHIWRGETGLPVHQAAKQGLWDRLVIVEGVEDGLSIALACPEFRVWAAGSLGNIGNIRLPRCCGEVIVCADNDWQKPAAMAEFERVLGRLKAQERPVHVARSPIGKDFNDVLQAKRGNA